MSRRGARSRPAPPRPASPLRVMIVDDHPVVRAGITQVIEDEKEMTVCCEASEPAGALRRARAEAPDLAIVDLSLGDKGSGLELVRALAESSPKVPVLVLSMHDERLYAERALRAGARGYIMKHEARTALVEAIRRVAAGRTYLSPSMSDRILETVAGLRPGQAGQTPLERLTDREREVYELIGRGLGTRQIAESLHLSVKTIESHQAHIKQKLGLRGSSELIRSAATWVDR